MKIFSIPQCFLIFLILTFITAPVSSIDCPKVVKLHHSVTLSCKYQCNSKLVKWVLAYNRDVVQARCNATSCWSAVGFSLSHENYQKGDNSLTITSADYSKRNTYTCECGDGDVTSVRLIIEPVYSAVQVKTGEVVKLNLTVPESVQVIYTGGDSADEVICNGTGHTLRCKDTYTHRTSHTHSELTLKHTKLSDSGTYTIRDVENEEDIRIYSVSVEDEQGFPVWGIILIVSLPLLFGVGLGTFSKYKRYKREKMERRLRKVEAFVQQAVNGTEDIGEAERSLFKLQQDHRNTEYSDKVSLFCLEKLKKLLQGAENLMREEWKNSRAVVEQSVQGAVDGRKDISEVKKELERLLQKYRNTSCSEDATLYYTTRMHTLDQHKRFLENEEVFCDLERVSQLCKMQKDVRELNIILSDLEDRYRDTVDSRLVSFVCSLMMKQVK